MNISAIIVNYRTPDLVTGLLPGLSEHPAVVRTVIVDNHPLEPLTVQQAQVEILATTANIGFGAAVNLAIRAVDTDWVLLINPDVRLENDCIAALVEAAHASGSPLLGPRYYWDHQHQFRLPPATGGSVWFNSALQCALNHGLERELLDCYWTARHDRFWRQETPFIEPFLSGACLLVDRSRLEHAPGELMDPAFFLYFEDTDLCARAIAAGHRPICVPMAAAVHYWNQSPEPEPSKAELSRRAAATYFDKHYENRTGGRVPGPVLRPDYNDLGAISRPPVIDPGSLANTDFCELALNVQFVPFAQADVGEGPFTINDAVWRQMAAGPYYMRTRSAAGGVKQQWAFQKT